MFAVRFALFGLLGPFAAVFIARYGLRRVMVAAAAFIAVAMVLATQVTQLWQLFLLWGLVLGCGTGLTALVLGAMVANRWFTARRGLVVGMLAASTATGQLIFLPVAAWLIEHVGWRYAVMPVFLACLVVALLVILFMQDSPKSSACVPTAKTRTTPRAARRPAPPVPLELPRRRSGCLREAVAQPHVLDPGRHLLHLRPEHQRPGADALHLALRRQRPERRAGRLGAVDDGRFDLVGTTLSGYLSDRFDNRKLLFWYYGLRGLSLFWLPYSTFTLYGLSMFALFYGLDWIATVPPTVKLAAQAFGKERAGLVFGWVFAAHQLGAATAAYGAGLTRTLLLTYNPALFAAGAACLVAAVAVLAIRARQPARGPMPRPPRPDRRATEANRRQMPDEPTPSVDPCCRVAGARKPSIERDCTASASRRASRPPARRASRCFAAMIAGELPAPPICAGRSTSSWSRPSTAAPCSRAGRASPTTTRWAASTAAGSRRCSTRPSAAPCIDAAARARPTRPPSSRSTSSGR